MKLYDNPRGQNPKRVRMFLAEKGVEIPLVNVDLMNYEQLSDDYLQVNSLGRVPVLELDDGTRLTESIGICRYLETIYPEPNLFGTDPVEVAEIEMWTRRLELEVNMHVTNMMRHSSPFFAKTMVQVPEMVEASKKMLGRRLAWLDDELGDREFIAGDRYTMADIVGWAGLLMIPILKYDVDPSLTNYLRWIETISTRPNADA